MADEADTQVSEQDASVEQTTVDSQSETQTQDSNATSTEGAGENNAADSGSVTASTGDKSKSEDQDSKQDLKPVSRRSAAYRISQLVEKNKTLKQQLGKPSQEQDEWEQPAQDETEQAQPDVASLVAKEVERRLNPVISESSRAADDAEISELFSGNAADRSKYEGQLRSMWNLPQYKEVAALDLYNMLRGKEMEQHISQAKLQAVEQYKQAEKEAKESSGSGTSNSNRSGKSGKSVADMTPQELEEHNQRVIAGQST